MILHAAVGTTSLLTLAVVRPAVGAKRLAVPPASSTCGSPTPLMATGVTTVGMAPETPAMDDEWPAAKAALQHDPLQRPSAERKLDPNRETLHLGEAASPAACSSDRGPGARTPGSHFARHQRSSGPDGKSANSQLSPTHASRGRASGRSAHSGALCPVHFQDKPLNQGGIGHITARTDSSALGAHVRCPPI
jgi:hypothetical protein